METFFILFCVLATLAIKGSSSSSSSSNSDIYPISLPGCPNKCGDMSIPYPFGTKEGCYLEENFYIYCNTTFNPPKAFLVNVFNVTEIMLSSGELRFWFYIANSCYGINGTPSQEESNDPWFRLGKFILSASKNKFTAVGCDTYAYFEGARFRVGCTSTCMKLDDVVNGSCAGIGCCQTSIPARTAAMNITMYSFHNHRRVHSFDRCSHAFVVEETYYHFNSLDFTRLAFGDMFPMILEWTVGKQTCSEAKQNRAAYACKAHNSHCYEPVNGPPGYRCNCSHGYQGNPYIQNGCRDIDECALNSPCNGTCINLPGGYKCSCPKGYKGDGRKNGTGCVPMSSSDRRALVITLVISVSASILLLASAWLYWGLQKWKLAQLRKKRFQENGGIALQRILSQHEGKMDTFKIFTAEELNKATNNYDESRVLGQGGQGTVYKGELPDTTIVAIKRSNAIDRSQVQQFVNEVVVLSQINHRNVVKLLGCCLETEIPILVYEFITNGTLFGYIQKGHTPQMPWHTRLRIASEIAGAISYLHSSASIPIIHRDIKTTNILLDESYTAKVSDFGTSKFAPADRTSMTTLVQGTLGYLDPEYFHSSHLTEKSDVYSFGVVLVELLTGERAFNFDRKEEERIFATYFVSSLKKDRLFEIVDENLKRQASAMQLTKVATIAVRCLNVRGEDRPSMKEVAIELEEMSKREIHPWIQVNLNDDQESEILLHGSMRSDTTSFPTANIAIAK